MIALCIPYWEVDIGKREILQKCINSFFDYDRLIVLAGRQPTLPGAWNQLLRMGFGMGADYVILSNDDLTLQEGKLADLCKPGVVESPMVNGSIFKVFHAHIFALPRDVYEKVGEFDERYKVYWADTDYAKRLVDAGIPVRINENVKVLHPEPARTIRFNMGLADQSDKEEFIKKWGREYFDPVMGK